MRVSMSSCHKPRLRLRRDSSVEDWEVIKGLFTSNSEEWETPQDFFNELDKEFHFDIDLCASLGNAKCARFITKEDDLLSYSSGTPWLWLKTSKGESYRTAWMNPPYGRKIGDFIRKAYECAFVGGMVVVCLVPARTDTKWWHTYCIKGEIRFIKGRLKFGGSKWNAPFPSAIVIFDKWR